jgi:hypothetical protein
MSEKLTAMVSTVKTQFDDYRAQIDKFTTPKGIISKVDTENSAQQVLDLYK